MTSQPIRPSETGQSRRSRSWGLIIAALVILVPAAFGFINKFWDFFQTLRTEREGAFTIVPMLTYLAVAAGLLCLLVWAAMNGMFRDIEQPKYDMLESEKQLDRVEDSSGR